MVRNEKDLRVSKHTQNVSSLQAFTDIRGEGQGSHSTPALKFCLSGFVSTPFSAIPTYNESTTKEALFLQT